MQLPLRRVGWGVIGVVAVLASMATIEICTSIYRIKAFTHRTGRIREGMTESEVRTAAGVPDTLIVDLEKVTDPDAAGASCRGEHSTAAMMYTHNSHGCFGGYLGWTSGIDTVVVCLDARRIVVNTHLEMLTF